MKRDVCTASRTFLLVFRTGFHLSSAWPQHFHGKRDWDVWLLNGMRKNSLEGGGNPEIGNVIHTIRGEKVILDVDLARIYGVETAVLNRAVKRNKKRFPKDFVFRLSGKEMENLRCQIGISSSKHGGLRYLPYAFTEHGAIMTATLLNSRNAVEMSVFVVRAFVRMRETLSETAGLAAKLARLEDEIKGRLDSHESAIVDVLQKLMQILAPSTSEEEAEPPRQIGFHVKPKTEGANKGWSKNYH